MTMRLVPQPGDDDDDRDGSSPLDRAARADRAALRPWWRGSGKSAMLLRGGLAILTLAALAAVWQLQGGGLPVDADAKTPEELAALQSADQILGMRLCVDGFALPLQSFALEPSQVAPALVYGQAAVCEQRLTQYFEDGVRRPELEPLARDFDDALDALLPDLQTVSVYYDSGKNELDFGAAGKARMPEVRRLAAQVHDTAAALRAGLAAPYAELRRAGLERAADDPSPGKHGYVKFAISTAAVLDVLADDHASADDLQAAVEALVAAQGDVRGTAQHLSAEVSDCARRLLAAARARGAPLVRDETAGLVAQLVDLYLRGSLAVPYPF